MPVTAINERERARELILQYGKAASSYQLLNPGISLWFAEHATGLVGYVSHAGVRVVAGSPVAATGEMAEVVGEFEAEATSAGKQVCYFGVESQFTKWYCPPPDNSSLILGGQPAWNPQGWSQIIKSKRSLRAQLNRARNKDVVVEEWQDVSTSEKGRLRAILRQWLDRKPLPTMHFMVEPDTLSELRDRKVFVAQENGCLTGYLVASPIPLKHGWLVEQTVRHPDAANGTAEMLIHNAATGAAVEGSTYFTLGLAPLAKRMVTQESVHPKWLWWLVNATRQYGESLYSFAGLEYFKSKFQPHYWEPIFAVTNCPSFSLRSVYAMAAAFTGGSPLTWMGQAIWQKL